MNGATYQFACSGLGYGWAPVLREKEAWESPLYRSDEWEGE